MTVHVRYNACYIASTSSVKQQHEIFKFLKDVKHDGYFFIFFYLFFFFFQIYCCVLDLVFAIVLRDS